MKILPWHLPLPIPLLFLFLPISPILLTLNLLVPTTLFGLPSSFQPYEVMASLDSDRCPSKLLSSGNGKETTLNPDFVLWQKRDRFLLSCFNSTMTESVISSVYGLDTSKQVWEYLANRFASPSKSRISQLKGQLQSLKQGSMSCSDLLLQVKSLADQLSIVGKPIDDDDLISAVNRSLNHSYHPFIASYTVATRDNAWSFDEYQAELLNYDMLLANHRQSSEQDVGGFALYSEKPKSNANRKNKPSRPPLHKIQAVVLLFLPTTDQPFRFVVSKDIKLLIASIEWT